MASIEHFPLSRVVVLLLLSMSWLAPHLQAAPPARLRVEWLGRDGSIATHVGAYVEGHALLPPGFLPDGGAVQLRTASQVPLRCVAIRRGSYPDGSARSVVLKALLPDAVANGRSAVELVAVTALLDEPASAGPLGGRVELEFREDGSLRAASSAGFRLGFQDGADLLPELSIGGASLRDPAHAVRIEARIGGVATSSLGAPHAVSVRCHDALSARLALVGTLEPVASGATLAFQLELELRAGVPGIEGRLVITGTDDLDVSDLALVIPLLPSRVTRVRILGGAGSEAKDLAFDGKRRIAVGSLDGQSVIAQSEGGERTLDAAARCGIQVHGTRGSLGLTVSHLRALAPRRVSLRGAAELSIEALPGATRLSSGVPLVVEFALGGTVRAAKSNALDWLTRERRSGLVRFDASALPFASALDLRLRDPSDPLPRLLMALDRDVHSLIGWRDYGDYRLGRGFGNLEYDPLCATGLVWLASGDARHARLMRDMLRHFAHYDLSRGEHGFPDGVPWMHGDEHRSEEVEPGHIFLDGSALAALVLEDDYGANARASAGTIAFCTDPRMFQFERDYGWGIAALAQQAVTFEDAAARDLARRRCEELRALQGPRGSFLIDRGDARGGIVGAYVVTPWVTGGVTLEALYRAYVDERAHGGPAVGAIADTIAAAVAFLGTDARYENGEYAAAVGYDHAGQVMLDRIGVADPVDRLLIACGFGRAALVLRERTDASDLVAVFEREVLAAQSALKNWPPLRGNEAARALVAVRSIADTRARLGGR